jgi:predicted ABC-type ATPase
MSLSTAAACSAGDAWNGPRAVWACGCAASGKTEIGRSAVLPLGFALIDTDQVFEELLRRHRLSFQIPAPTAEEQALVRRGAAAGRTAQRLAVERGEEKAIWPKMADLIDPLDYLEDKETLTQDHLYVVAREITRRALVKSREERRNLLIVETGGQTGKTLNTRKLLGQMGYETFLVWVELSSLDDALRRNRARGAAGGRCLPAEIVERSFTAARKAREKLIEAFQPCVLTIDNSEDGEAPLGNRIEEVREAIRTWLSR